MNDAAVNQDTSGMTGVEEQDRTLGTGRIRRNPMWTKDYIM